MRWSLRNSSISYSTGGGGNARGERFLASTIVSLGVGVVQDHLRRRRAFLATFPHDGREQRRERPDHRIGAVRRAVAPISRRGHGAKLILKIRKPPDQ